jgi:DNA gyrase subunit A
MRRAVAGVTEEEEVDSEEEVVEPVSIDPGRYAAMSAAEDLLLTVTEKGAGKLSSSHDYPLRGRGGQGVQAIDKAMRGGPLVTLIPVTLEDQIMLATDAGQSIRVPVAGISFRSRSAGGVRVFNTGQGERVVSVALVAETGEDEDAEQERRPPLR